MRVLIVDDETSLLTVLRISLNRHGIETATAENGMEALEILKNQNFDWLVTDGHMPSMTGFELARQAHEIHPEIKVIMITGVYLGAAPSQYIQKVFTKPLDDEALAAYLQTWAQERMPGKKP